MRKINEIHLHHSASNHVDHDDLQVIEKWHLARKFNSIGYHYFIDRKNGQLFFGREIEKAPASIRGRNDYAVAICLSGDFSKKNLLPNDKQMETLLKLLKNLLAIFDLKSSDIYGHNQVSNTLCPGFDMDYIRSFL
jgi:hypothetical protein